MDKVHFGKNWDFSKPMDYPILDQLFKWLLISSIVNDGKMVSHNYYFHDTVWVIIMSNKNIFQIWIQLVAEDYRGW